MSKVNGIVLLGFLAGFVLQGFRISAQEPVLSEAPPIFRVTVVGRTTAAINYRPRSGSTTVDMVATGMLRAARGVAEVSGKKGLIEVDARFENMGMPTRFGDEYLTYVLWAITPEGRATNLGEVQLDDEAARIKTTTELQAFGLIVTAEPYFAVTQPSDVVVMENQVRDNAKGKVETIEAKYELLQRGSYLMNQSAGLCERLSWRCHARANRGHSFSAAQTRVRSVHQRSVAGRGRTQTGKQLAARPAALAAGPCRRRLRQ